MVSLNLSDLHGDAEPEPSGHWSDQSNPAAVRRQAIRRLRFGLNLVALDDDLLPPEGPVDVALTNGLAALLVAETGDEAAITEKGGRLKPASGLLDVAEGHGLELPLAQYRDLLNRTQPFRHGRADDEWRLPSPVECSVLEVLDDHWALQVASLARQYRTVDGLLPYLFEQEAERASGRAWLRPKEQLEHPAATYCENCGRNTFMQDRPDDFGGNDGPGVCAACGYLVGAEESDEAAAVREIRWRVEND